MEKEVRFLQQTAEERVSSLEQKDLGIAADATDVYPSMNVEQEAAQPSHGHECEWHEPRPEKEDVYVGGAWLQSDMEVWFSHLRDTLYQSDDGPLNALEDQIRANWERIDVTACRTPANRFFHVRCKQCNQYSYGQYGYDARQKGEDKTARADLAQFFKVKEVPVGRPIV